MSISTENRKNLILSYKILRDRKYYSGRTRLISTKTKISEGYSITETFFEIDSHTGTHIDYPAHFIKEGKFGDEYPLDYLFTSEFFLAEIDTLCMEEPYISLADILNAEIPLQTEILFVKTGFCNVRNSDRYWQSSPVVSADIPLALKEKYKNLKAVGFDIISVASLSDKAEGKKCHYNFLSEETGEPILIIEDIDMRSISRDTAVSSLKVHPLNFEKMDGAPCVVIAETRGE